MAEKICPSHNFVVTLHRKIHKLMNWLKFIILVFSVVVVMLSGCCKQANGQTETEQSECIIEKFLIPDYEGIQTLGQSNYNALIERFNELDTTWTIRDFQSVYYGSAFYGSPSSGVNWRRIDDIMETNGNDGVIAYVDSILSVSPFNLGALRLRFIAAYKANDSIATNKYLWQYDRLLDAIYATGDAREEKTALHVVCVNDEYTIMYYVMQVEIEQQTLTPSMCDKIDIITEKGTRLSVYFDVQLVLALEENRINSSNTEPFKFIYQK